MVRKLIRIRSTKLQSTGMRSWAGQNVDLEHSDLKNRKKELGTGLWTSVLKRALSDFLPRFRESGSCCFKFNWRKVVLFCFLNPRRRNKTNRSVFCNWIWNNNFRFHEIAAENQRAPNLKLTFTNSFPVLFYGFSDQNAPDLRSAHHDGSIPVDCTLVLRIWISSRTIA